MMYRRQRKARAGPPACPVIVTEYRIAATNATSDVYAMGGAPIMALAILGMPVDKIAPETVRMVLEGGRAVCAEAGIPIAGGHSIDCPEPVYGLAVIGTCKAEEIRRNADARPGDAIILTKPLGVGIYSAAIKKAVPLLKDAAALAQHCAPDKADEFAKLIVDEGYPHVRVIGRVESGQPGIRVEA